MIEIIDNLIEGAKKRTWSSLTFLSFYITTVLTINVGVFALIEFLYSSTEKTSWYFIAAVLIISNFVYALIVWHAANYVLNKSLQYKNAFCSVSLSFPDKYNQIVRIDNNNNYKSKKSDLWYLFVNTRCFDECKKIISEYLETLHKNNTPDKYISDIEMWSLLGASELLFKFRASVNFAYNTEKELLKLLGAPIPVNTIGLHDAYIGNENSILESTHKNKKGLQLINCTHERILKKNGSYDFEHGRLLYVNKINHHARSMKVFIKFHFDKNNNYDEGRIRDVLPFFKSTVELLSTCEHQDLNELKFVIIEAHYACGKFNELFKLSEELEQCLEPNVVKETYIGYSGGLLFPEQQEIPFHA